MQKAWAWIMSRPLVALVGGLLLGIAIGAGTPAEQTGASGTQPAPQVTATVTATATTTVTAPTPEVTITRTVKETASPPAGYRTLVKFTGRGEKTTEPFTIPFEASRWRVCFDFKGGTNAQLTILHPESGESENVLNEIGNYNDCTTRYEPTGTEYALEICCGSWTIKVQATND